MSKNNKRASKAPVKKQKTQSRAAPKKTAKAEVLVSKKAIAKKIKNTQPVNVKAPKTAAQSKKASKIEEEAAAMRKIETEKASGLVNNATFLNYINSTVGPGSSEIMKLLIGNPITDDVLADKLSVKINEVRRMLNVMNGYGIVRYDVNKDSNGWLFFKWRIDKEKLSEFITSIDTQSDSKIVLQDNCNDFYYCKGCHTKMEVILPFDTAVESNFKCDTCGKLYVSINRQQAETLLNTPETAN